MLRKMLAAGWFGRKSGIGFYDYSGEAPGRTRRSERSAVTTPRAAGRRRRPRAARGGTARAHARRAPELGGVRGARGARLCGDDPRRARGAAGGPADELVGVQARSRSARRSCAGASSRRVGARSASPRLRCDLARQRRHPARFWPVWVIVVTLIPVVRNGWRLFGPAPDLEAVERRLNASTARARSPALASPWPPLATTASSSR